MALTDSGNGMYMPVAPAYMGGYGNGFGGGFGGYDSWWVILFLFALMGNGGWGGFGGYGGNEMFPYFFNTQTQNDVNRGFDNAGLTNQLSGISTAISNGFANAEVAGCNRAMDAMQTAYTNQIADMNQNFALQSQLANCCCENRLAVANLGSDIAREACATRTNDTQNTQSILNTINGGIQSIKDQLCQDKIDAKNEKIADLERQLTMANLAASQGAQTAQLLADNSRQTAVLEDYLNPVARPAYIVQNPNCCTQNYGCGCGNF